MSELFFILGAFPALSKKPGGGIFPGEIKSSLMSNIPLAFLLDIPGHRPI